ncbi:hypothetical protein Nepgr_023073 [Nepenthes gracilis]|uniref:Uncharacterized protein n=1 Tax=Nepenthes gracilis TaxID=150966 RepID=A0AAD3T3P0_NEPGR|nr:hypothetical protein Nepgr_023073 [Nepenthes gracilis]
MLTGCNSDAVQLLSTLTLCFCVLLSELVAVFGLAWCWGCLQMRPVDRFSIIAEAGGVTSSGGRVSAPAGGMVGDIAEVVRFWLEADFGAACALVFWADPVFLC